MQSPFELVPVFDADNGPGYGVRLAGGQTQFWGLSRISDSPRILAAVALDPEGARRSQPGAAGPQTTSISTVAQPRAAGPQTTVNSGGVTT